MIKFSKLQGAGNDFVIINLLEEKVNLIKLAKTMCDRHFGIGADGLMAVADSSKADIQMIYYNSDGSRGEMCGNGLRCFSKYVFEKQIVNKDTFTVETLAGIKKVSLVVEEGKVSSVKADMGTWDLNAKHIPVETCKDTFLNEPINVEKKILQVTCVLMGVPHAVVFVDKINTEDTIKLGPKIENMEIFPRRVNVNFVQIVNRSHIKVDTWERGAGKTLACGTGACAAVVVAHMLGLVEEITYVSVSGGDLRINITENEHVIMEGKAEFICDGEFYV